MGDDEKYELKQTNKDRPLFTCRYLFDLHEEKKLEKCSHRLFRYQVVLMTYQCLAFARELAGKYDFPINLGTE